MQTHTVCNFARPAETRVPRVVLSAPGTPRPPFPKGSRALCSPSPGVAEGCPGGPSRAGPGGEGAVPWSSAQPGTHHSRSVARHAPRPLCHTRACPCTGSVRRCPRAVGYIGSTARLAHFSLQPLQRAQAPPHSPAQAALLGPGPPASPRPQPNPNLSQTHPRP